MARSADAKLRRIGGANRHYVYLPMSLVGDERFPLRVGQALEVRIEGDSIIITRKTRGKKTEA